ncbi:MAG: LPS export ABC transporter periplasmic protein LptC [Acidobacteriales bacterium]|nr:LPS export ABC transporter periplasmic protein LptC [Terriglobales bacterium]
MPLLVSRLRRWFAAGAIAAVLLVAGTYFYARQRVQNAINQVPSNIGLDIQQSAQGFSISRSEQGRTLFKVQASKAVQFKAGGRAELHDVTVTMYGRDAKRFDQIYGADFIYDQSTGDVIAQGPVQIDLENNPEGLATGDQQPPKELKNPIHLKTSGLVFNQKTGNAHTKEPVEFSTAQIEGSASGVTYSAETSQLVLESNIIADLRGPRPLHFTAMRGTITKEPRQAVFDRPRVSGQEQTAEAQEATFFLRDDNSIERMIARREVKIAASAPERLEVNSGELELRFRDKVDEVESALFSGGVEANRSGADAAHATAGEAAVSFGPQNRIEKVHADHSVKLGQAQKPSAADSAQNVEIASTAMDLLLNGTGRLVKAETAGPPQIRLMPASGSGPTTTVTAAKFTANFDAAGQLMQVHGAPAASVVSATSGHPDRTTTSDVVDAQFQPGRGISALMQQGHFSYVEGDRRAWADQARYTTADQQLLLSGSPRVAEGGMTTTADAMQLDRASSTAVASGNVKSTYADLKANASGALLASSNPIHVTAQNMKATNSPVIATYTGNARLWQGANVIQAPILVFDRDHRSLMAQGTSGKLVSTVLVQANAGGKVTPVTITSTKLTYSDDERVAHFSGGVVARAEDGTLTARQAEVFLKDRGTSRQSESSPAELERVVAEGDVVLVQPNRRATGDRLVYSAGEGKYVLAGGPPCIFDAERGRITGLSLTFFSHDDRVLVEGSKNAPAVTQTRVAR